MNFVVTDRVSASVDVGTGNVMVSTDGIDLPGISGRVSVGATYNTLSTIQGSNSTIYANDWTYGFGGAGSLSAAYDPVGDVVWTAGDGATWMFAPVSGSTTAFTSPAGLKADLVKNTDTYTLTQRDTRRVITFDLNGNALSVADRNASATSICYTLSPCNGVAGPYTTSPLAIVSPAGAGTSPTASLSYDSGTTTLTITQSNGSSTRSVQYVKDRNAHLTAFIDATGKQTSFAYTSGSLSTITSPTGAVTNFSYDSSGKVNEVDQLNTTSGSPGTSSTRFSYSSSTQTLVAGPDTAIGSAVSTVPHITYTIDATKRVTSVVDEQGRQRSTTYTANFDTATSTTGTGATAGTTTDTYGANSGQSLTSVAAPDGATTQAAYGNTNPATQFLPASTTSDASNRTDYTYDGLGNPLSSAQGTPTATATLTYNSDGTVATALGAGNGSNATDYSYTSHQLTGITPPTGTTLGARALSYDDFGRPQTVTDGKGVTVTYGYDNDDRLLSTSFSDSTHSVVNTYDAAGKVLISVDGSGTITNSYDQLERLTSTVNTAGGGTESFSYDQASHLTSLTDSRGTTTYTYDTSGVATQLNYDQPSSTPGVLAFATDDHGRRTDEWLQANADHTTWSAHTHTSYDTSGRVTEVAAYYGTGDASNTKTFDVSYCYSAGAIAPSCPTTPTADRHQLQWSKDTISGMVSAYSYDPSGRLSQVAQSGATGANTYTYTYDARGNRLTATVTGATPSSQTLTYNPGNQITTTGYSYDGAGNLTATPTAAYTYNGAEQMTSSTKAGTTSTYTYAGAAQNAVLSENTSTTSYGLSYGGTDQQGQPEIQQIHVSAGTGYLEHDPITGQPLLLRTSTGKQSLYVFDGTGNPTVLITSDSYVAFAYTYDPYGVPTLTKNSGGTGMPQNPYLFKGGIQDRGSGLVKFGLRWYDPVTGRWTQQDTLDAPLDPANANRYAFAGDDPVNGNDPTGIDSAGDCTAAVLLAGGALALGLAAAPETGGISLYATGMVLVGFGSAIGITSACGL